MASDLPYQVQWCINQGLAALRRDIGLGAGVVSACDWQREYESGTRIAVGIAADCAVATLCAIA
jgi:hypothetical protein